MAQRILVTGCSSGIGRALTAELSARGHHVIATARDPGSLGGLEAAARLPLDVTDSASVARAVEAAGPVDVLVNNAGATIWGAVETPGEAEVQRLFETNVFGMLRMVRAFAPGMRRQGRGGIFQISSAIARRSNALLGHYAATKAALDAYSEALRLEMAPFGIKVCIVSLGGVESSFAANRREFIAPEYAALAEGVKRRVARNRKAASSAQSVATRIADAIDAGEPPLRLDGTGDAFALIAQRAAQNDEEWERISLTDIGIGGQKQ